MKNIPDDLPVFLAVLPVACLILNREGLIERANPAADRLFGFENGRLPQRPFFDFLPADYQATLQALLQETADNDAPTSHELQITAADGRAVWVRAEVSQIPEQTGCCLVLTDIDAYKWAVAKASQSKVRLNALIENAPDGISLLSADGRFIDISPSARRILGYEPDAMLQHNPTDYIHHDDLPQVVNIITALQDEPGSVGHATYRVRHADGSWRHIESTITNLLHEPAINSFIFNYRDVSDRMWAENRYQMLVEQNPAVIYLNESDETGINYYVSPQIETLLGYSNDAYAADRSLWHSQVFPDDYELAASAITEVRNTGQSTIEYRMLHRDGRIVWVRDSCILVRDEQGEPQFVQGFLEDITDQKRAEETLRASERFLQATLDSLSAHIAILDEAGTILAVNEAWRQYGRRYSLPTPNDAVGANYLAAYNDTKPLDDDSLKVIHAIRQVLAGKLTEAHLEYPCHSPSEQRWFVAHITSFFDGTNRRAVIAHENVTERKLAEHEMHDSEQRFRLLIENAPGAITLIDKNGRRKFISESTERVMGYRPEDLLGGEPAALTHPDDAPALAELLDDLMQEPGQVRTAVYRFKHKDGSWRWVESTITNLLHIPAIAAVAFNFQDITRRKQMEEELHQRVKSAEFQAAIGVALVETADLRQMLQKCTEIIIDSFDAAFARIWVLDEEEQRLNLKASAGLYTHLDGQHGRIPVGKLKIGHVAQEREPHLSNNLQDDPHIDDPDWARQQGLVAFAGYPLLVEDKLVGTLALFARQTLSEQHVQTIGTVVNNIAQAIERKQMEEEMRRLANRLTITLESITDAFFTLDREWRFTYINQEAERILERTRDEILGKVIWEEFAPAVGTAFELEYRRATRENSAVTFEEFYSPLERWLEVNAYPSEEGLAVYFRDISRRKQDETQLQQQLDELRRWYRATLGREMRILDLKQEINTLLAQAGQPPRYRSAEADKIE